MDTKEAIAYVEENKIEGSYVECGVEKGKHPKICASEILAHDYSIRDIYLYDTFAGLPEPSERDKTLENNGLFRMSADEVKKRWKKSNRENDINGWCYCSLGQVQHNMKTTGYPEERLHFVKGNVMDTLKVEENLPSKIAVLRLDTDWYDSSKFELEVLYDRVSKGGVLIFDDYYLWKGQHDAVNEFFEENGLDKSAINRTNKQTAYYIKV